MTLHVVKNQAELESSQLPVPSKLHHCNNLLTINCLGDSEHIMAANVVKDAGFQSNMEVDYVISYRFATTGVFSREEKGRQHTDIVWQIEQLPKPISRSWSRLWQVWGWPLKFAMVGSIRCWCL